MAIIRVKESLFSKFFLSNTKSAVLWLIIRLYVGWEWIIAGWEKIHNPIWAGSTAGKAVTGFVQGALQKTGGMHPDVQSWYAYFLKNAVATHPVFWSNLVAYGEVLVGVALIIGFITGISAFFGVFMNMSYLLAGTVSTNPVLLLLGLFLMIGWKVSGYIGADYFVLPVIDKNSYSKS